MPKDDHPPSFPLYVDDLISDSAVDAMTNEEFGIYMRLLCKAWKERPVGTIPDDDAVLARWAKATRNDWARCKAGVLRAFTKTIVTGKPRWKQKRMAKEWAKMVSFRKSKAAAGLKGAESRWHNHSSAIGLPMAKNGLSSSSSSSLSSSPSNSDEDVDGARDSCFSEEARVKANRIAKIVPATRDDDRELVAKVAKLWDGGRLADDDVEQVLESFAAAAEPIKNRVGWFYECLSNKVADRGESFDKLLATTALPDNFISSKGVR